jgi:hypothetical protein
MSGIESCPVSEIGMKLGGFRIKIFQEVRPMKPDDKLVEHLSRVGYLLVLPAYGPKNAVYFFSILLVERPKLTQFRVNCGWV